MTFDTLKVRPPTMRTVKRFARTCAVAVVMLGAATSAHAASILIAPSEADNPAFNVAVAAIFGDTVTYLDARSSTPSVAALSAYDAVFTWANYSFADETTFGNNLADYVDGGGRVILGAFSTFTSGNSLGGDIMTAPYSPVTSPSGTNHFSFSSYAGDGTSGLWTGVGSYGAFYRDFVTLQGSGIVDGHFLDGEIAAAYRPDFAVIYLGGMETLTSNSGDYARLLANAVHVEATAPPTVPEPVTLLLFCAGGAGLAARRRRSVI